MQAMNNLIINQWQVIKITFKKTRERKTIDMNTRIEEREKSERA